MLGVVATSATSRGELVVHPVTKATFIEKVHRKGERSLYRFLNSKREGERTCGNLGAEGGNFSVDVALPRTPSVKKAFSVFLFGNQNV